MFKFGIVGAGAIANSHKEAVADHPECTLMAICDLATEKAQKLAEGTDAHIYTDFKEMADKEELDAVILNLPHFLHKDVSIFFLEKGIAVLVEKPMALCKEECDEMIAAAKKTGTCFAVGHVQKYYEPFQYMREIINNNTLGKLCATTETRNLNYFKGRPGWFVEKDLSGGGILANYGAHSIDRTLYLTGLSVESVNAVGTNFFTDNNVEATAQILLKMSDGSSAAFTYCGTNVMLQYEIYFYFTEGSAHLSIDTGKMILTILKGSEIIKTIEYDSPDLMHPQLAEFVKMLKGEESLVATPEYGREIMRVLDEAYRQM